MKYIILPLGRFLLVLVWTIIWICKVLLCAVLNVLWNFSFKIFNDKSFFYYYEDVDEEIVYIYNSEDPDYFVRQSKIIKWIYKNPIDFFLGRETILTTDKY